MCGGVYYSYQGEDVRLYFPNPMARLPACRRDGGVQLLIWGRRQGELGHLPLGGWASLDAIYAGRWDKWFPVPVKIPLKSFMERDIAGHGHWFDLTKGQWVQGLIARDADERRVYVVTVVPELAEAAYERWPRILGG